MQINPRVSTQFTGHGSRVLHALEAETGKSFLFEGSEGLTLDHFAITFMGTRAEVEERALPFRQGDEVLVEIVEPHMYDVDDAVAKIDGYIISIAGAAPYVGEKRMVRIDQVGRTAASALLLDESGEVLGGPRASARHARQRAQAPLPGVQRRSAGHRRAARAAWSPPPRAGRRRGRRGAPRSRPGRAADRDRRSSPRRSPRSGALAANAAGTDDAGEDDLQSKPRRRGRRGGRRRSAAKAKATPE